MQVLFWKALFGLLVFDLLMLGQNFGRLHRIVSTWRVAPKVRWPDVLDRVCDAINQACIWYPKKAKCLHRSVVTVCLLRSYGVPAEMVLGARKLPFNAHAWVEVDGRPVNERTDVQAIFGVWDRC